MKLLSDKRIRFLCYTFSVIALIIIITIFAKNAELNSFFNSIENRTFDVRQKFISNSGIRKVNKDIVLLTIDDTSYEYLLENYGEWPVSRSIYANLINYLETSKPKTIAFDLIFVKSKENRSKDDIKLANAITKNKNVYASINFDNLANDARKPEALDKKFSTTLINKSKVDFSKDLTFKNFRPILTQITEGTNNVGLINVSRDDDGILRGMPALVAYKFNSKTSFYPHLALLVGLKALGYNNSEIKNLTINKNAELEIADKKIPLDKNGNVILNWYGPANGTFTEIPIYKLIKSMNNGESIKKYNLQNKIIYIGTTATSLYDPKTVPVDKIYPGVEIHSTFVNNFINNEFITKAKLHTNILISIVLAILAGVIIFNVSSTYIALSSTFLLIAGYVISTYYVMKYLNLWLGIITPVTSIIFVMIAVYIVKYILKSRDFEHQYKLATTDGLTELYNHRYFQEQMRMQIENCKRYNTNFSLIFTDIDFFKKFNDIFGHQSGDAVLRQVAAKFKKNVRSSDFVCRYGGEEMSIILPNADKEEAVITAQKLCQIIAERPFKLANNEESKVTISLGVSTYPQDGETPDAIIAKADEHLYYAKEHGRNQVGY